MLHYLDYVIAFLPPGVNSKDYFSYCEILGLSNGEMKKMQGQLVVFLGIELDSALMETRLPADKLDKAKLWVIKMSSHDVIEYDGLQSFAGFLSFAAKVV